MKLIKFLSIIFYTFQYSAFGPKGHYIVARVAEKYLETHNPTALEKLNTILNSITTFQKSQHHPFVEAATYSDDIKGINWKIFNKWHYDNQAYIPAAARKKINKDDIEYNKQNLVWAINELKGALRNTTHSMVNDFLAKAFSLNQLIHFVGDIHQPLHTIDRIDPDTLKGDKGGNDFKIVYVGSGGNLHSFWDKCLKMFPEINQLKAPISKKYWKKLDVVVSELMTEFPEKGFKEELEETSIRAWQKENYKIAVKYAYANLKPGQQIQDSYLDKARPQLKRLMVLGGYRLGKMLEDIYNDDTSAFELHLKDVSNSELSEDEQENSKVNSREDQSNEEDIVNELPKNKNKKRNQKRDHTYEPSVQITEEDEEFSIVLRKNRKNGMILKNENYEMILSTISFLIIYRKKKFKLNRTAKQRWHLIRTLVTQLITHERINSTYAKAYHMQPTADRVLRYAYLYARTGRIFYKKQVYNVLTTKEARDKAIDELGPRYLNSIDKYTRVKRTGNRKGDNAPTGRIELRGNPMELLEKQKQQENLESGKTFDMKKYNQKLLKEEEVYISEERQRIQEFLEEVNQRFDNCKDEWDKFQLKEQQRWAKDQLCRLDATQSEVDADRKIFQRGPNKWTIREVI